MSLEPKCHAEQKAGEISRLSLMLSKKALAWSIMWTLTILVAGAATGEALGVSNAVVEGGKTSLQLPSGAPLYVYALTTGGAYPTSGFSDGEYASVTNVAGNIVAAIAITTSNTNSYTTQTSVHDVGGVAVSGFSNYSASYSANGTHGASFASDTFTVQRPGSLVLVIAIGGGEQCASVAGVPGFDDDTSNFSHAIVIGHAYLGPGTYAATETTSPCAGGSQPSNAGALISVIVFSASAGSKPQADFPLYAGITAAVAIVVVVALVALRRRGRKAQQPTAQTPTEHTAE